MKKLVVIVCMLVVAMAAQAQFEKGKWIVNPSLTGLNLSYNTESANAALGIEAKGGAFVLDNFALMINLGANFISGPDVYKLGVGGRYYLDKVGVFLGGDLHLKRFNDVSRFGGGLEAGYAFFLSRTVTIEPAAYWDINRDRSEFGLKVGFGLYF